MSHLEEGLAVQLRALKVPRPEREYRFAAQHVGLGRGVKERIQEAGLKDWRFDFAWPEFKFAVEVEGGIYINGRHNRGDGYAADLKKYHHAMALGWSVYRCGSHLVRSGKAANLIAELLTDMGDNTQDPHP